MKTIVSSATRGLTRLLSMALLLSILCAASNPQEQDKQSAPPAAQASRAVLKVITHLVTVDVVARDRHGKAIRDLKASDFQISEQSTSGKSQQQIASFRLLDRAQATAPDSEKDALQLPAGVYTNLVTTKNLSAPPTILLVDGLNTDAAAQVQVRQKMVKLLASSPTNVPMAVFLLGRRLQLLQNFTTDTKLLKEAAQRALTLEAVNLQAKDARDDTFSHSSLLEQMAGAEGQSDIPGGASVSQPGGSGGSGGGGSDALLAMRALELQRFEREQYAESVDVRVRMTLDALRVIARHVSGYPGRKNLIWLSSAFPLSIMPDANLTLVARFSGARNYGGDMAAVASALTDAQVSLYPIDPRGVETQALFDPQSQGKLNPFSEGATLHRESDLRYSNQETMENLADQTGGQICLNNNDLSECVRRAIDDSSSYYELSYYPVDKNWRGEFRKIFVKTTRPGVQLSFRRGYYARESDTLTAAKDSKETDSFVSQAACNDFLTATSVLVQASAVPPDQPGLAKYFLLIDANSLSFDPGEGGARNVQLELATCMFNARGLPLQFNRQTITQKFSDSEFQALKARGLTHTISLAPKPETARVRLLVCDSRTGMVGSVDLPYPGQILAVAPGGTQKASEAAGAAAQASSSAPATPHVIKFHDKEGRTGILQWDASRLVYAGDLPAESSARGMFDSLWSKEYSCQNGKLLAIADKTTPAPQPLHFRVDDEHSAEVYLDSGEGLQYSGNVVVDSSAKPVFEALRTLYRCAKPVPPGPQN